MPGGLLGAALGVDGRVEVIEKKINEGIEKWKREMQVWLTDKLEGMEDKLDKLLREVGELKKQKR